MESELRGDDNGCELDVADDENVQTLRGGMFFSKFMGVLAVIQRSDIGGARRRR